MKKIIAVIILLFLNTSVFASIKYLFTTKLLCEKHNIRVKENWRKTKKIELETIKYKNTHIAFNKKYVWTEWDPINQNFKYKYKITLFNKDKIIASRTAIYSAYKQKTDRVVLNRLTGSGSYDWFDLSNCKVIKKLPVQKVKQKF